MNGLSSREQRLVAIAILIACIAAVWFLAVAPILNGFTQRQAQREETAVVLAQNRRLIAAFSVLRIQDAAVRRGEPAWSAPGAALPAATELARERVSRAVEDSGGALEALRDEPGPPNLIHLQADAEIGLDGLQALIRRLEDEAPYGAIVRLSIAASDAASVRPAALQTRIDVTFAHAAR